MIRQNNSSRMNHRSRGNSSRMRGEGDERGPRTNSGGRTAHESSHPNNRARGNPRQLREKYMALAQEALSTGNIIDAETYYQHADHYYRLLREEFGQSPAIKSQTITPEKVSVTEPLYEQKFADFATEHEEVE